jgi:chemotaxis protein histidine kinase CheA
MLDINDPDMFEIVIEFCDESDTLIEQCRDNLENFEDEPTQTPLLEKYGQIIDRMMGAASTLGLDEIASLCKMGKIIGYKSSQCDQQALNEVACGVLFDLTDLVETLVTNLREKKDEHDFDVPSFSSRLQWLAEKFKHIERASCDFQDDAQEAQSSQELDQLISGLDKLK